MHQIFNIEYAFIAFCCIIHIMLTSTLGGLIKDHRIKKRLSQLEVSLRIGWKDSTRLSKIEQGRVGKPTRETLDKIVNALELNAYDRGQIFLATRIVPTSEEVNSVILKVKEKMKDFKYPLMLVDFTWNTFYFNKLCIDLFKLSDKEYRFLEKNKLNWLELLFLRKSFNNVKLKAGYTEMSMSVSEEYFISHFKFEQSNNTSEKWFRNLLLKLSKDSNFRKLWAKTPPSKEEHFYNYEINHFTGNWRGKEETLRFHIFAVHPTFDSRFALLIHQPADVNTFKFYAK